MALPGDAAALRFHVDMASGTVMVHDPHRQTLSAVVRISHPAYVLLSPDDQARRVAAWSRVLAGLGATGSCAGVQILESTLPDPGHGVRDWYLAHGVRDGGWADAQYAELMAQSAPASYTHRTLFVLSLDMRRAARAIRDAGRGIAGAAEVLRGDMATVEASLRAADLRTDTWLGPSELAVVIRQAYDPTATRPGQAGSRVGRAGRAGRALGPPAPRHRVLRGPVDQRVAADRRRPALPAFAGVPAGRAQVDLDRRQTARDRRGAAGDPQGEGRVRHRGPADTRRSAASPTCPPTRNTPTSWPGNAP